MSKNRRKKAARPLEEDYPIPEVIVTREGLSLRTNDTVWIAGVDTSINWKLLSSLPDELFLSIRAYICRVLVKDSAGTAQKCFGDLTRLRLIGSSEKLAAEISSGIGMRLFHAFRSALEEAPEIGRSSMLDSLSVFRRWYIWCADCEFPGFDGESALELSDLRIGGSPQGIAVLRRDPDSGPLSFAEDACLESEISRACEGLPNLPVKDLQRLAALMLSKAFGLYARHLQLINEHDYSVEQLSDGSEIHWLNVPRVKKRGRGEAVGFRRRRLPARLALVVSFLVKRNAENEIRSKEVGKASKDRPLFVRDVGRKELFGTKLHSDAFRWKRSRLAMAVSDFCYERGMSFHVTPRRLRYSFATRLVEEGCSPLELADALDHTDLQHVMVYFNSRGQVVRQLDEAVALRLAPLASAFLGRLIPDKSSATRPDDPASSIRFGAADQEQPEIGSCGQVSSCGKNAPLACYTCARFEPWKNAPHEEVLGVLLQERRRRHAAGMDEKIVQIHDATIVAVAEVVRRCNDAVMMDIDSRE
ncbi:tyrosine-type recombinase/integrase [Silanimonas sp.]|uniref:tyrosine-type recombinase/integrase n=1 Tax=Silanimonas sp. TaxID=1929290 RepID=UPI002629F503|nr:tyrosine-type recombinase/integrase [Silanimonas sp.]